MNPADPYTLPQPHDDREDALHGAVRAFFPGGGLGAPGAQLALLGEPGAQLALDGRAEAPAPPEARSAEPSLGPLRGVCGGHRQLVLDLADTEAIPQLGMFDRLDVAAELHGSDTNEAKCHRTRHPDKEGNTSVRGYRTERGAWQWTGTVSCEKWACPRCGMKRARDASKVLGVAIRKHRASAREWRFPDVWMLTPTVPHGRDDLPGLTLERLFAAWRTFEASATWRAFREKWAIDATPVRVLDNTQGGANGAHPHFHILLLPSRAIEPSVDAAGDRCYQPFAGMPQDERERRLDELALALWPAWDSACASAGVERARGASALKLSPSEKAAAYFVGWGLADEVGATPIKARSHLRLLDAHAAGFAGAGGAYIAWCAAVAGKQWVSGLGKLRRHLAITEEECDAYVAELQAARDAAAAARGEPVQLVRPLYVWIPDYLYPTVPRVGWGALTRKLDEIDARGGDVQLEAVRWLHEQRDKLRTPQRGARDTNGNTS